MGRDTYMVTTHQQGGFPNSGDLEGQSAIKANSYCSTLGKQMVTDSMQWQTNAFFRSADNTFMFHCYAADDPRNQPPNLRPTPTAVIQVQ
jgi:hypothetical protein